MKRNAMVQWMNLHQKNSFVNRTPLSLLCEKSRAIPLVLVGLTAGMHACRQFGRQSDEILVDLEILKISLWITLVGFSQCLTKVQCYYYMFHKSDIITFVV